VTWTRLLLLSGADESRLNRWSRDLSGRGDNLFMNLFKGKYKDSWRALTRQVAFLLLRIVSRDPWYVFAFIAAASFTIMFFIPILHYDISSESATIHLKVIATLLSPSSWTETLSGATAVSPLHNDMVNIMAYLLRRDMMIYLACALEQVVCLFAS
jgi:hypothetical protein